MIVGLSLISLRNKEKAVFRPFKTPGSISIRPFWKRNTNEASASYERYTIPIIGVLTIIADLAIWLLVVVLHPLGRIFGSIWMGFGLLLLFAYTRIQKTKQDPSSDSHSAEERQSSG